MVLILRSLHPNYKHVRDQILSSEQIPSMNSLVTRLLRVPTITNGDGIAVENFAMVASRCRGRSGGHGRLICSNCGKEGHLQNKCYDLIGWPDKTANISSDEEYQEFLRLKSNNHTQSSASSSPLIIDSSASDHIFGNESVFSSISSPKFPYFISLANGSKMDRNTGQLIDKGHESRGLYYLSNNTSMLCFASVSPKLLHNHLAHPSLAKLKLMVPSLNKLFTLECKSCQLSKHVRSTFPNQINKRCNLPFSIIHSDIWGPSRVTSFGFNYFVTFIDEYSRCTWVYLMRERSELLSILMSFSKEVENQFGKIIKILRRDNAKEYFSSKLNSSESYINSLERKNRYLVETARTLLLSANVPTNHWGEAILTACFLINRMPSASLENQIPHSILFPKDKMYHVPPKVFGCVCFVHDVSLGRDKLSARAIKCVFLGYSRLQKGYKCYSPSTKRHYMSADVTFFEETMFFTKDDCDSIQQALPIPYLSPP
ncbi:hypothetical protein CR513_02010, partial [Mucuna pruriens]